MKSFKVTKCDLKTRTASKVSAICFYRTWILMISSVLSSERADKVNMLIIDTFVKLRELFFMHKDEIYKIEQIQNKVIEHDNQIMVIFEYLKQLEKSKLLESEQKNGQRIGFYK